MAEPVVLQIERALRLASPYLAVIVLIVAVRLPFRTDDLGPFMPFISIAFVYYWTVHSREGVSALALLGLGFLEDAISGAPLGLTSILLIVMYWVLANQQKFFVNRDFAAAWIGFSIVSLLSLAVLWLLWSFYEGRALPPIPLVISMVTTVAIYPVLGLLFGRLHKAMIRRRW